MLKKLQEKHKIWADENFADRSPILPEPLKWRALELAANAGKVAHAILKTDQGIRGPAEKHQQKLGSALHSIRNLLTRDDWSVVDPVVLDSPPTPREELAIQCCLGVVEEAGELAWAVLRGDTDEVRDAVGDVFLYLLDLCNRLGFDMEEIITEVAEKVHGRDWNENPWQVLAVDTFSGVPYDIVIRNDEMPYDTAFPKIHYPVTRPVECPKCSGRGWYKYTLDRRPRREYEEKEHIQTPCPICDGFGDLGLPDNAVLFVAGHEDPIGLAEAVYEKHPNNPGFKRLYNAMADGFSAELAKVRHIKI